MNYINTRIKHYKRVYIRQIIRDIWDMEYTPVVLAVALVTGVYILATSKLVYLIVGGL